MRPYVHSNQSKSSGGIAQAIEHLHWKHKALSSNISTTKKRKEERKGWQVTHVVEHLPNKPKALNSTPGTAKYMYICIHIYITNNVPK
jgi:hypothetical protein